MRKGDVVIRVRGKPLDQLDAEKVAKFIAAAAELYAPARLVRVDEHVIVFRRDEAIES